MNVHESTPTDFSGVRVLIAGGTSGVGLATASAFAQANAAHVTLLGRNEERGAARPREDPPRGAGGTRGLPVRRHERPGVGLGGGGSRGRGDGTPRRARELHGLAVQADPLRRPRCRGPRHDPAPPGCRADAHLPRCGPADAQAGGGHDRDHRIRRGEVPTPGKTALGAAMAAIVTFSKTLALEVKRYGIRVNTITPSLIVNTGSYERVMEDTSFS